MLLPVYVLFCSNAPVAAPITYLRASFFLLLRTLVRDLIFYLFSLVYISCRYLQPDSTISNAPPSLSTVLCQAFSQEVLFELALRFYGIVYHRELIYPYPFSIFISSYLAQEKVDAAVLQDWEEHLYDDVFVVERVYDGPIDGWFYVEWGPVYQSDHREAARYVQCRCDPCVTPCIEDRVPEADLQRTAPLALAAYKSTALYERRLQEYELAAILRSTA